MILLRVAGPPSCSTSPPQSRLRRAGPRRRGRLGVLAVLWPSILLSPLLVPPGDRFARFLAAIVAVAPDGQALRPARRRRAGAAAPTCGPSSPSCPTSPRSSCGSSTPSPGRAAARTSPASAPRGRRGRRWVRSWSSACSGSIGRPLPFAVEHCAKVVAFFLALVPATAAVVAAWRLLGGRAREPDGQPVRGQDPGGLLAAVQPPRPAVLPRGRLQAARGCCGRRSGLRS